MQKRRKFLVIVLASTGCLHGQAGSGTTLTDGPPPPIQGTFNLPDGQRAQFTYYFDRNALADGVLVGKSLLAVTDSGNLIRFDADTLGFTGQTIVPGHASSVALDLSGNALVGTEEGDIYRVDSGSLRLDRVTAYKGKIAWIGVSGSLARRNERIVTVVDNSPNLKPWPSEDVNELYSRRHAAFLRKRNPYSVGVYEGGKTRVLSVPSSDTSPFPGHFLVDLQDRLWMGADNGEWGGECGYLDLLTGHFHALDSPPGGVLGFGLSKDAGVLVFGGSSHLGMNSGYIAEIKQGRLVPLLGVEQNARRSAAVMPPAEAAGAVRGSPPEVKPNAPIDLVLVDNARGGFWVVSAQILYHADDDFNHWQKGARLGGRWGSGRRLSVGNTPTVRKLIANPEHPDGLLAVMGRDGLERISGTRVEASKLGGELESPVLEIWNTSLGTALMEPGAGHAAWFLKGNTWNRFSLFPDHPPPGDGVGWNFAEPFGNGGMPISAVEHGNVIPGKTFLAQLGGDGTVSLLDSWGDDDFYFDRAILTASDGTVLRVSKKHVSVRQQGAWREAGTGALMYAINHISASRGRRMVLMGSVHGSDYFWDAGYGDIFQLSKPSGTKGEYSFARAAYPGHVTPVEVLDAVPEGDGRVLLSTRSGLIEFNLGSGQSDAIPSPNASDRIKTLCRDSVGRLWAAGDSVYISSDGGKQWGRVKLPIFGGEDNKRIRADAAGPERMILTLENTGVVLLDWHQ